MLLPTTKHCYFCTKYKETNKTEKRTVWLPGVLKAIHRRIIQAITGFWIKKKTVLEFK